MRTDEIIGLIPAAGHASRVSPLPCSKELFPIGFEQAGINEVGRPKVIAQYLLESMRMAGAVRTYFIIRNGKWDIPAYFSSGKKVDLSIGYVVIDSSRGVPFTINAAFPFIEEKKIVFGFPDIVFQPEDAYASLLNQLNNSNADIVLGLFPAENKEKMDMVDIDPAGNVRNILIKPETTELEYTWLIAVWRSSFSLFVKKYISLYRRENISRKSTTGTSVDREIHFGEVIIAAVKNGLTIDKVIFKEGVYIDIGTPEDMARAVRTFSHRVNH